MRKTIFCFLATFLIMPLAPASAFWVWTPETNKWINPKYAVKDTPAEQLDYAKEFYRTQEYAKAINEFGKLIKYYPKAKEAPLAQFHIGLCYEEQEKLFEAVKAYQVVVDKYPFSDLTPDIIKRQYQIGEKMLEGEGKKGQFASAIVGGEYNVIEVFRGVIKNAPYGQYAAPSQYKIGLYLMEKRLYQEARDEFEKLISDYPESEWVKPAQYQIALADAQRSSHPEYEQQVTKAAVDEFQEFVKNNPDAQLSDKAQEQIRQLREKEAENNFVIARFYEKQKNYQAARIYYNTILEEYQGSPWAIKALEKLRELDLRKK